MGPKIFRTIQDQLISCEISTGHVISVDLSVPAEASNCPRPAQGGEMFAVILDVVGIFLLLLFLMPMPMEDIMIATPTSSVA